MEQKEIRLFFRWLKKSHFTETDIINCRKMQALSIVENENVFGISTISVCGFINNDVVKLGGEFKQQYAEDKKQFILRTYGILMVCANLMDAVNAILVDEGSWSANYFSEKFTEWKEECLKKYVENTPDAPED